MKNPELKLGERVELYAGQGPYYRTVIDDISDDGTRLAVSIPTYKGIPLILRHGQTLKMIFYRENGRFSVSVTVFGFNLETAVRTAYLQITSPPERQQRREAFRMATMLRVILRPFTLGPFPLWPDPAEAKEMEETLTVNISATGMAVRSALDLDIGSHVYARVFLEWPGAETEMLDILGEVRRIVPPKPGRRTSELGLVFQDMSIETSSNIAKYVLMEEQRRRRQQRLIEEE